MNLGLLLNTVLSVTYLIICPIEFATLRKSIRELLRVHAAILMGRRE